MKIYYYIILAVLLVLASCEKEEDPPADSDEITVTSQFYGTTVYYVMGYSFELGKPVSSMPDEGEIADIIPEQIITPNSEVIGVQLSSPAEGANGFYKNAVFSDAADAREFYENYTQAVDGPFVSMSDTIRENQVYTFLTHKNNFVKFIINDVRIIKSESYSDYVEVDLEYFIQRDGTKNLQQ